ncbi:MAG: hypothetical protein HYX33_03970 [Actinobacteria bacterium]|nr:hypothetical protein [Actinomycetota bacterium]
MFRRASAVLIAAVVAAPVGLAMAAREPGPTGTRPSKPGPAKPAVKRLVLSGVLGDDAREAMLVLELPRAKGGNERGTSGPGLLRIRLTSRTRITLGDDSEGTYQDLLAGDRVVVTVSVRVRGNRRVLSPAIAVADLEPVTDTGQTGDDGSADPGGEDVPQDGSPSPSGGDQGPQG